MEITIAQFLGYSPFATTEKPTISNTIKDHRLIHGLSQRKLAKILGIDPTTLARWENGRSRPGALLRGRLTKFLGIPDNDILQKTPTVTGRGSLSL